MANPTSAFGWQMPTSTDLVTDLPADFEVFGQAVDTSLADLKGGTTGQVLSKATNADMDFTWVTSDDANAIQNAIVDAKGDLIAATANDTPARLAVGANDLVLTAASGETTGLKWSGAWTTYTPTWAGLTVGNGTVVARYCQVGKLVTTMIKLTFGSTTSISGGFVQVSIPVASSVSSGGLGTGYLLDALTAEYAAAMKQDSTTVYSINPITANNTYAQWANLSATVPFTWGTNDVIQLNITYEAA